MILSFIKLFTFIEEFTQKLGCPFYGLKMDVSFFYKGASKVRTEI